MLFRSRVVAVGGDGTINEVVNGLMSATARGVSLGIVPGGTGSDLVRTLKVPTELEAAVHLAVAGEARPLDVMRATFHGDDGQAVERWGMNVIGMGLAGDVVRRVNAGSKAWGGTLTFLGATLSALAAWSPVEVEIRWTDERGVAGDWRGRLVNAFVGNGQFCGGGVWLGPAGRMDDGLLELMIIPQLPVGVLMARIPHLYTGKLSATSGVVWKQIRSVSARVIGDGRALADVDGEQPGGLPVHISVLERALSVVCGAGG